MRAQSRDPADLPYPVTTSYAGKCSIESGNFPAMLQQAVADSGYHERPNGLATDVAWRGLAVGMESTGFLNYESARVQVDGRGHILVSSGLTSHGQGQATTLSRVCAKAWRRRGSDIDPPGRHPAAAVRPRHFASRGAVVGANAVHGAAMRLRARALACAGHLLQADPATLTIAGGRIERSSGEATALGLADVARALQPYGQLYGSSPPLDESFIFDTGNRLTFALSVHVAKVALDPRPASMRSSTIWSCTTPASCWTRRSSRANSSAPSPTASAARCCRTAVRRSGAIGTGSLADYLVVTAAEAPAFGWRTPRRRRPPIPGVRGVGEGGIIAVSAAIINALSRAIAHRYRLRAGPVPSPAQAAGAARGAGPLRVGVSGHGHVSDNAQADADEGLTMARGALPSTNGSCGPFLFRLEPETAHRLALLALRREFPWSLLPSRTDDRLAVTVGDWHLTSPIGLAAGFDKDGDAVRGLQHLGFGYLTVGSILPKPSAGHPRPRLHPLC